MIIQFYNITGKIATISFDYFVTYKYNEWEI